MFFRPTALSHRMLFQIVISHTVATSMWTGLRLISRENNNVSEQIAPSEKIRNMMNIVLF